MHEAEGLSTPVGTRRSFYAWVTGVAAGLIGLGLAGPLIGYVVSPALKRRDKPWVEVGEAAGLPVGEPTQLDYIVAVQDGWLKTKLHKAVWALKAEDGSITVYSPMCPHLGCGYRWDGGEQRFKCPCHLSVYDRQGSVVSGPAPRPLDRLPHKVEDGRLYVIYKEFKSGLPIPVEI